MAGVSETCEENAVGVVAAKNVRGDAAPFSIHVSSRSLLARSRLDAGGGEELVDLGGVLDDVQGKAADDYSVWRALVSMGCGQGPRRGVIVERIECSPCALAAVLDVSNQLGS